MGIPERLMDECADAGPNSPRSPRDALPEQWFSDDLALAHIYPQFVWHSEAKIIANASALRLIADAALEAIDKGRSIAELYAIDGEGYGLEIERSNDTGLRYTRRPYVADFARCDEPDYAAGLRSRIAELEAALAEALQASPQ